jgi:hypothetical protein
LRRIVTDIAAQTELLARWQGVPAKLWGYSVTHSKLAIRLHAVGAESALVVIGVSCDFIQGPLEWTDSQLSLLGPQTTEANEEPLKGLQDSKSGFRLLCSSLVMEELPASQLEPYFQ